MFWTVSRQRKNRALPREYGNWNSVWKRFWRLSRSRGGFSTKIHLKTDLEGNPLDFHLTGGEASDSTRFETSLDIGPDIRPRIAMTDRGYDSQANRAAARARGITPVIPRRENSKRRGRFFPKRLYKLRHASNRQSASSSDSNASPCAARTPIPVTQPSSVLRAG
jgi:transposase